MTTRERHAAELDRLAPALDDAVGVGNWVLIKWPADDREHGDLDILTTAPLSQLNYVAYSHGYQYDPDPDQYRLKYVNDSKRTELDFHTAAAWVGIEFLDAEWVCETAEGAVRAGVDVTVPSPEAELLIWAAHDMRSNKITAADVAWCRDVRAVADLAECRQIASEHCWRAQFERFLSLLDRLDGAPESAFPYHQGFWRSLAVKVRKPACHARRGDYWRAARDVGQYLKFDLL